MFCRSLPVLMWFCNTSLWYGAVEDWFSVLCGAVVIRGLTVIPLFGCVVLRYLCGGEGRRFFWLGRLVGLFLFADACGLFGLCMLPGTHPAAYSERLL
jgi:hypothetical protein